MALARAPGVDRSHPQCSIRSDDERQPLLSRPPRRTPLPWRAIIVLMIVRLGEPIAATVGLMLEALYVAKYGPSASSGHLSLHQRACRKGHSARSARVQSWLLLVSLPSLKAQICLLSTRSGLVESIFMLGQALTVLQWGRLSDRVGRKPVLRALYTALEPVHC